jgi:phage gp36-like protein
MAYLTANEITSVMYQYQLNEITDSDSQIVEQAIAAAVEEMKSYLSQRYDTHAIFAQAGAGRNALILENTKVITVWNIIRLSNVDAIYDMWRERYDRVIDWLKRAAAEKINPDLPPKLNADGEEDSRIKAGSNLKFTHDF